MNKIIRDYYPGPGKPIKVQVLNWSGETATIMNLEPARAMFTKTTTNINNLRKIGEPYERQKKER